MLILCVGFITLTTKQESWFGWEEHLHWHVTGRCLC